MKKNVIELEALSIDGHSLPISEALSELLQNCWAPSPMNKPEILNNYEREVFADKDGNLVSVFKKINSKKQKEESA